MFEHSKNNLDLFALEPIVTFADNLIGRANGDGYSIDDGVPNANAVHVIHNNSFTVPPQTDGLAKNKWHQDDTPHALSLDGKPLTNIRLNVLIFTVNYYLTKHMGLIPRQPTVEELGWGNSPFPIPAFSLQPFAFSLFLMN